MSDLKVQHVGGEEREPLYIEINLSKQPQKRSYAVHFIAIKPLIAFIICLTNSKVSFNHVGVRMSI